MAYNVEMSPSEIELPWPDKALWPNARVHWAVRHKAVKAARKLAFFRTLIKRKPCDFAGAERVVLRITFVPPDKRSRDKDNMIACMKPSIDGVADAIKVDDSKFDLSFEFSQDTGGFVLIEVSR